MRDKYQFLLALKLLECEIRELTMYSQQCCDCFELLKSKLDALCQFMTFEENQKQWQLWEAQADIREYSECLRETSIKALCNIEKYQSVLTCNKALNLSEYIESLANSAKLELEKSGIDHTSKVLFIGMGAFPVSAITIAQETKAEVMGLDIDAEAVALARELAKSVGLDSIIQFSNASLQDLAFSKSATHVIIASLVKNKLEILANVKATMKSNAKIIVRYGNGLKSIFNYPLEINLSSEWKQTKLSQHKNIYDTIILEKPRLPA